MIFSKHRMCTQCPESMQISQPPQDIIHIGDNHQQKQEGDPDIFCPYHELLTGLATSYHLIEQEEDMTAIEGWNRKDIHEGKDDAQESCHHPEHVPIPIRREEAADRAEAT